MTKKLPSEELSWEEAVSRYLEDHPDYFQSHPEVLAAVNVPHIGSGGAVSLIERQVQVLRGQNQSLSRQLRELVEIARENDVLGERLQHFAVAVLDAASLEDVLGTAQDRLRQEFRLDAVVTLLRAEGAQGAVRPEFVGMDDRNFEALVRRCEDRKAYCGGKLDAELMRYLFAGRAGEIQSLALIPLKDAAHSGLLCMGSRDAHRFHPDMGTVYLLRLGEIFMHGISRYLRPQASPAA